MSSPVNYKPIALRRDQAECPNCDCLLQRADLAPISIGCILRFYARESSKLRKALLSGSDEIDEQDTVDVARKDTTNGWGSPPKVLARLNHRLSELTPSLQDKLVSVCGSCYALFADVREMEHGAQRVKIQPHRPAGELAFRAGR